METDKKRKRSPDRDSERERKRHRDDSDGRSRDRHKDREKDRERDRGRDKDKEDREKDREKDRERDRDRGRDKEDREKDRERDRSDRDRDRGRDKGDREKDRERDRDSDRTRDKDRDRSKEGDRKEGKDTDRKGADSRKREREGNGKSEDKPKDKKAALRARLEAWKKMVQPELGDSAAEKQAKSDAENTSMQVDTVNGETNGEKDANGEIKTEPSFKLNVPDLSYKPIEGRAVQEETIEYNSELPLPPSEFKPPTRTNDDEPVLREFKPLKLTNTKKAKVEIEAFKPPEEETAPVPMDTDVDPLEAYMASISDTAQSLTEKSIQKAEKEARNRGFKIEEEEEEPDYIPQEKEEAIPKRLQRKALEEVDHSKIDYQPFRKDFYVEVPEIARLTPEEVKKIRKEADGIKIRGKLCPPPIRTFTQCGLSNKILAVLEKCKYEKPTPIQAQAIPAVMSGRDVVGIAKTGSGKTLAFLLPMFRHIADQAPLAPGDGPIGLIMVPTRELATQIHQEVKKFKKATGVKTQEWPCPALVS